MQVGNTTVYAIFATRASVENALDWLRAEGFRYSDVSVLFSSPDTTRSFAHENTTKAPEGAAVGGGIGALVGGSLGWLAGIGAIAIPGVGPFIAAGPVMALLAGIGTGATVGGLSGALVGLGIPEYEASRYEGRVQHGGILLSVHADNSEWAEKAKGILEETGGEDVSIRNESSTNADRTAVHQ
ncbi:MAG: quinol:electron acceptor oxidoreductase subunit ActD [Bdellovibrionota bacterium]